MTETHLSVEVASQPDSWRHILTRVPEAQQVLPATGQRVAVAGCGTSYYMAQAYAALREESGAGLTDAFAASEFPLGRDYDAYVLLSRSGTTTEVIELQQRLQEAGKHTVAIVATAGTAIAEAADATILLPEVDETSVVQTRFATSALALLRASLGEDLSGAIADCEAVLAEDLSTALAGVADAEQVTFIGRGWTVGIAQEAALKLRESAQFWTEAYPAMEYRHGPISIATTGRATWAFGAVPDGLAQQVQETGATFVHRNIDPLAELVRVHRLCIHLAEELGLDPDQPRHLTRSIILS